MTDSILTIVISIGISGLVQTALTSAMLKTDMGWVKRELRRMDAAIIRAHERIDALEDKFKFHR